MTLAYPLYAARISLFTPATKLAACLPGAKVTTYPAQNSISYPAQKVITYPAQKVITYPAQNSTTYPAQKSLPTRRKKSFTYPEQKSTHYLPTAKLTACLPAANSLPSPPITCRRLEIVTCEMYG